VECALRALVGLLVMNVLWWLVRHRFARSYNSHTRTAKSNISHRWLSTWVVDFLRKLYHTRILVGGAVLCAR
jgi:hypothetical protein